jgi:hypothetical protein
LVCVAVGEAGTILRTADGLRWAVVGAPTSRDLAAVTSSGSLFVAVGDAGVVLTSTDGVGWWSRESGTSLDLEGVCAGPAGLLVAVGEAGTVLVSTDGATWRVASSGAGVTLRDVVWAAGTFVAVGDAGGDGFGTVCTSPDALRWRCVAAEVWGDPSSVEANGGQVVLGGPAAGWWHGAVSGRQLGELERGRSPHQEWEWPGDVVRCGDRFVGVGVRPGYYGWGSHYSCSLDGVDWEPTPSEEQLLPLAAVTCGPNGPLAVGRGGQIASSPDGAHWRRGSGLVEVPLTVAAVGDRLLAMTAFDLETGGGISPLVLTSDDGAAWSLPRPLSSDRFFAHGLAGGAGCFVVVGTRLPPLGGDMPVGGLLTSANGVTWQYHQVSAYPSLDTVTWDGERFVAAGSGWLLTSPDGATWQEQRTTGAGHPLQLASDGERLVAVLDFDRVMRMAGGTLWEPVELPVQTEWRDVAFAAGRFVLVGDGGAILSSEDGATWKARVSGTEADLLGVDRVGDGFVVTGVDGTVLVSDEGLGWRPEPLGVAGELLAAAASRCGVTVTGRFGLIARSECAADVEPPRPAFAWRPPAVVVGEPVGVTDLTRPSPLRWRWDFGDDAAATGPRAVHAWSAPGSFAVSLEAANRYGVGNVSAPVEVMAPCGAPGVPTGLTAPPSVPASGRFEVRWGEVEGAEGYWLHEVSCRPAPAECVGAVHRVSGTSYDARASGSVGGTLSFRVGSVRSCFDGFWPSAWSGSVVVEVTP